MHTHTCARNPHVQPRKQLTCLQVYTQQRHMQEMTFMNVCMLNIEYIHIYSNLFTDILTY